jgi:hypothetical protein
VTKRILENPSCYACTSTTYKRHAAKALTRKARFSPDDDEADCEDKTRSWKRISVPKAMGRMGLELLLSTSKDGVLSAGKVNDLLEGKVEVLMEFDTSAYRNLKMPPTSMTKMFLTALLNGNWSLNDPTLDKKGFALRKTSKRHMQI